MPQEWYYSRNGEQSGPFSTEQLLAFFHDGTLTPGDLVWNPEATEWAPASQYSELGLAAMPGRAVAPVSSPAQVLRYQGPASATGVVATARALEMLRQTRPWVLFISIVMFIGAGLMVLAGLIMGVGVASMGGLRGGMSAVFFVMYVAMGLLYIAPAIYLSRYSGGIRRLMAVRDGASLELALEAQKSFWRFVGIMTAVVIGLYALAFFGMFVFAIMR